jgi:hypothetical protein
MTAMDPTVLTAAVMPLFEKRLRDRLGDHRWQMELRNEGTANEPRFVLHAFRTLSLPNYFRRLDADRLLSEDNQAVIDYLVEVFEAVEADIKNGKTPSPPEFVEKSSGQGQGN